MVGVLVNMKTKKKQTNPNCLIVWVLTLILLAILFYLPGILLRTFGNQADVVQYGTGAVCIGYQPPGNESFRIAKCTGGTPDNKIANAWHFCTIRLFNFEWGAVC
jgi:hypothetical protein